MRRPIAARNSAWARSTARFLARRGVRPNAVSGTSVFFALLAGACLVLSARVESQWLNALLHLCAALFIQARLLCNLFDGMLAVEWKRGSALGPIYNDLPDRPADVLILAGAGYAASAFAWSPALGWVAAALALLTAYVRVLGVAVGAGEHFTGPMAKPHRMAALTIASVLAAGEVLASLPHRAVALALLVVAAGCVLTIARRLKLIARDLSSRSSTCEPPDEFPEPPASP